MNSIFGINNYIEVDLEKPLQLDPLEVIIAASKVGLYSQFFTHDGRLHVRIAGEFDSVLDFHTVVTQWQAGA